MIRSRHGFDLRHLKPQRDELVGSAYATARLEASTETDLPLDVFPETNPFTLADAMNDAFWPGPPSEDIL